MSAKWGLNSCIVKTEIHCDHIFVSTQNTQIWAQLIVVFVVLLCEVQMVKMTSDKVVVLPVTNTVKGIFECFLFLNNLGF